MKSLNVKMKLKLVSLMLVGAMVLCINPVARADSPERFAGPSLGPSGDDNSERVIQPTKPTFAPPLGDVNSDSSDVRLRRLNSKSSNLGPIMSSKVRASLAPSTFQPSVGEPIDGTEFRYLPPMYIDEPSVSDTSEDTTSMDPWEYLPLPTLAEAIRKPHYVDGEIIVAFKSDVTENTIADLASNINSSVLRKLKLRKRNTHLLKVTGNQTEDNVINQLKQNPDVLYAERNAIVYAAGQKTPGDTSFSSQWNLHQNSDDDIDAPEGWYEIDDRFGRVGDSSITIAVIDTGIDWDHNDLAGPDIFTYPTQGNIWINVAEWNGSASVDDDDNGYTDDYFGYDFVNTDNNPLDDSSNGHGTHVSGIASAITDNSLGVAGTAWNCKIMPLKVLNNLGSGTTDDLAEAIDYAADNGARVINMSLSFTGSSQTVETAVEDAYADNVVLVAAAGNDGNDLDVTPIYPACYDEVICVSATDKNDTYTSYTNYGSDVDVAAPGGKYATKWDPVICQWVTDYAEQILSTVPSNTYGYSYGTSMASPHVAGLAALCFSINPFLYNYDVKDYITDGADDLGSAGKDDYYGYGRINVYGTANITPVIIYVDVDATGDDDGSSWTNAYNELQNAFDDASSGDQIFIAAGTYYPDEGDSVTDNSRSETFQLINGVAVRGAFAGYGESNPYYRNTSTYTTTLSGDIDKDSVLDSDNSYHVVKGVDNALLEAFTITKGYANGTLLSADDEGAGMYNNADSPTIALCTFSGNYAAFGGGMMNKNSSSPTISSCTFSSNTADPDVHGGGASGSGGGMYNAYGSNPTVTDCLFSSNTALCGAGLQDSNECNPTFTSCMFYANSAEGHLTGFSTSGGGMTSYMNCSETVTNCLFVDNSAEVDGGAMAIRKYDCSPNIINCLFYNNHADGDGGAICSGFTSSTFQSNPTIVNCTFYGNSADDDGGGIWNGYNSDAVLKNCIFWGDTATSSGGEVYNYSSTTNPTFSYCDIEGGLNGTKCGGYDSTDGGNNINSNPLFAVDYYHLTYGSPCIDEGDPSGDYSGQVDIDGEARVMGDEVDMGVDEYDPS